jgi:hypothetical protein
MAFTVPVVAGAMTGGVNAVSGALTGFMLWLPFQAARRSRTGCFWPRAQVGPSRPGII